MQTTATDNTSSTGNTTSTPKTVMMRADDLPELIETYDRLDERVFVLRRTMSCDDEYSDLPDLIEVNNDFYDLAELLDVEQTYHPIVNDYLDPIEPLFDVSSRLPDPLLSVNDQSVSVKNATNVVPPAVPDLQTIMSDIEQTVNFNTVQEGVQSLNNPEELINRIQNAFDTFKEKTGRGMTYSEMRYMMG